MKKFQLIVINQKHGCIWNWECCNRVFLMPIKKLKGFVYIHFHACKRVQSSFSQFDFVCICDAYLKLKKSTQWLLNGDIDSYSFLKHEKKTDTKIFHIPFLRACLIYNNVLLWWIIINCLNKHKKILHECVRHGSFQNSIEYAK